MSRGQHNRSPWALISVFWTGDKVETFLKLRNAVFWDVTPCGSLRTDVLEERSSSNIRVIGIGDLGTTLAITSNGRTLRRIRRFVQEPHSVTSQKTAFFIVTAVKTLNLTFVKILQEASIF
jgi:hypothetical protein